MKVIPLLTGVLIVCARATLIAQDVTLAEIRGIVRTADGPLARDARVSVTNIKTGFRISSAVRNGRFVVTGLEVGGPYQIIAEQGELSARHDNAMLRLGEPLEVEFVLQPRAFELDTLHVTAVPRVNIHGGAATVVPDSLLHRLPTLNRDLYDFVRLVPQVSTNIAFRTGLSGGGVGFRFNNFLINGVSERTAYANATTALSGGKSLPLEAVKEYQVLIAPYDVRYGDFAGALVNTVTNSGTNEFKGSIFAYGRSDELGRSDTTVTSYERVQYGFSLSGPIIRDRLHFFVAPELQHLTAPASDLFLGSTDPPGVPLGQDIARLDSVMRSYGLVAGSAGAVQNKNPLTNIYGRLDFAMPARRSRVVLWGNYARSESDAFARVQEDTFPLSSHQSTQVSEARTTVVQLHTSFARARGGHNELRLSHDWRTTSSSTEFPQPLVRVTLPTKSGGSVTASTGSPANAHGTYLRGRTMTLGDHLTLPVSDAHVLWAGVQVERLSLQRGGLAGSYGSWTFASVDDLAAGSAVQYEVQQDFGGANAPLSATHYSAYLGDQWRHQHLTITVGMRADLLSIDDRARYNATVDSIFGRRTDAIPDPSVHLSPRMGFSLAAFGSSTGQLRGGVGVFTGRLPMAWLVTALTSYGEGVRTLRCDSRPNSGPPPAFVADYRNAPQVCATGVGAGPRIGDVDLLDPNLRMARTLRTSLAYDRRLLGGILATVEALYTRNLSDFIFVNLNLAGPVAVDRNGRVLYGRILADGVADDSTRSDFREVIDLRNTSRNRSVVLSGRLEKQFTNGIAAIASYTHARVRDTQTPLRTGVRGTTNWSSRFVSGRHDDLEPGTSLNDVPHRVVLAGTFTAPWRWRTQMSFYYVGESGSPFTYRVFGTGGKGDLNADGSNANDPIYVPLSAHDVNEILFSGLSSARDADNRQAAQFERITQQQAAFENFIQRTDCLRRQRGRIMARNSCREPWFHTTVASVRQKFPAAGRGVEAQLDIFNVLNLLNSGWGQHRIAVSELLEHFAQQPGTPATTQPIFRYNTNGAKWTSVPVESMFQLQLGLRYRF